MSEERTEYDAAFEHGAAVHDIHSDGMTVPFAILPDAYAPKSLEDLLLTPTRIRAKVALTDEASFQTYVDQFKTENTRIFAKRTENSFTAVIDYHGGEDEPSWCTHTAKLTLELSIEWRTWMSKNNQPMKQVDFAEFLEDNLADIAEPESATIMESATKLEAKKSVAFKSGINLDNGAVQFEFAEEINGTATKGHLKVPTKFTLGLSPFVGGPLIKVPARLRYRISGEGLLTFTYIIERPHKVIEFAFDNVLDSVATGTQIRPLLGSWSI